MEPSGVAAKPEGYLGEGDGPDEVTGVHVTLEGLKKNISL
jgi:hypothetical protein